MSRLLRSCLAFAICVLSTIPVANASLDWEHFDAEEYYNTIFMTEEEIDALPADWNEHVIAYEVGMRKDWIYLDDDRIIAYGVLYDSVDDAALADQSNPSEITDYFYFTADEIAALPVGWEDRVLPYSPKKDGTPWRALRDWIYLDDVGNPDYPLWDQTIRISYGKYCDEWTEIMIDVSDFIDQIQDHLEYKNEGWERARYGSAILSTEKDACVCHTFLNCHKTPAQPVVL